MISHKTNAFTLIEVLIAGSLAAVVLVGTFLLLQSGIRQNGTVVQNQEFTQMELAVRSCILGLPSLQLFRSATPTAIWYNAAEGCKTGTYDAGLGFNDISFTQYIGDVAGTKHSYHAYFLAQTGATANETNVTQTVVSPTLSKSISYTAYK